VIIEGSVKLIRLDESNKKTNLRLRFEQWKCENMNNDLMELLDNEYKYIVLQNLGVGGSFGEMSVLTNSNR